MVAQPHKVQGKVMEQDVEARAEGKKVVFVDKHEEVNEDRVRFAALDEDKETVVQEDEGA